MESTSSEICKLVNAAFSESTKNTYLNAINQFDAFRNKAKLFNSWPAPCSHIAHFVAYLSLSKKSPSTAKTYVAALATYHKLRNWSDPTDNFLVQKVIEGFSRSNKRSDIRLPITLDRLKQLVSCLHTVCYDSYETVLFTAAFTLAFFAFLRISELLGGGSQVFKGLQSHDVYLTKRLTIYINRSKTDQSGKGQTVSINPINDASACPVLAMKKYLEIRPSMYGPLFVHNDRRPLSRRQFQAVLSKAALHLNWQVNAFTTHSFRIGAATTAAMDGRSDEYIKNMGRWSSSAYKTYIRL